MKKLHDIQKFSKEAFLVMKPLVCKFQRGWALTNKILYCLLLLSFTVLNCFYCTLCLFGSRKLPWACFGGRENKLKKEANKIKLPSSFLALLLCIWQEPNGQEVRTDFLLRNDSLRLLPLRRESVWAKLGALQQRTTNPGWLLLKEKRKTIGVGRESAKRTPPPPQTMLAVLGQLWTFILTSAPLLCKCTSTI